MMTNFNFLDSYRSCPFYFFLAYLKKSIFIVRCQDVFVNVAPYRLSNTPQTFNITRKIMVATQHLHLISTQGVTVYGPETFWHVYVLNVATIPPWPLGRVLTDRTFSLCVIGSCFCHQDLQKHPAQILLAEADHYPTAPPPPPSGFNLLRVKSRGKALRWKISYTL